MLMQKKLSISVWGHAIQHATTLVLGPKFTIKSPHYNWILIMSQIFSILKFLNVQYMFQLLRHNTQNGSQRRLWIYVGYEFPYIIKYLKPMTWDLFMTRSLDCHFDESFYPALGRENKHLKKNRLEYIISISSRSLY